jgi:hypothetical protein
MAKIKNYPSVYFVCKDGQDLTLKHFKTSDLAEKHAKKMGFENYEIKTMYLMTR